MSKKTRSAPLEMVELRSDADDAPVWTLEDRLAVVAGRAVDEINKVIRKRYDTLDERPEYGEFEGRVLARLGGDPTLF